LNNKNILIIGQGKLVGLPLGILLKNKRLNINTADASTNNLSDLTADADIIITATGSPKLLTGNMVKDGVIVLDAGAAESDGRTVGDVDYESVEPKCSLISKVPGGIGPVTVACLLENVLEVSSNR
jgi:methylenetetrahydrofolate dehydrogenase (NADP+)/methenyltetrahydrofolate cyclohydrolase